MRAFGDLPLKEKLTRITMATSAIALLLASGIFVANERLLARQALARDLSIQANMLGAMSTAALTFDDQRAAEEILTNLRAAPSIASAALYTADGRLFATYMRPGAGRAPPPPFSQGKGHRFGDDSLELFQPILLNGAEIGTVYLQSDLQALRASLLAYAAIVAPITAGSLVVAFLLAWWLQHSICGPIVNLARVAREVSERKDYTLRVPESGRDEVGALIASFNHMLTQIQDRDQQLQRYREHLEEQVVARTAELSRSNVLLKQEIVERHQVEAELREREERYRVLTDHTYDLICEVGAVGQFLYASPSYREVLGYEPESLLGRSVFDRVHPEDVPPVLAEFERGMRTLSASKAVFRFRHNNGDWRWFESTANAFRTATGEIHGVIVSRDITERRRIEEERLRASKLESVGLLAGGIAHDFNNVLTAILGNVSLAKLSLQPQSKVSSHLLDVEKACLRAKDLTQRLLTFAKGGAPVKKAASLADLVRESTRFALSGSNIRCEFLLPDGLWPVEVDEGQMSQVLHNLVINAHQAMPTGGRLTVAAENADVGPRDGTGSLPLPPGPYLKLRLSDEGIGIAPDHLSKVFDPYFTTKQEGSGLGLATAYSVVKNHGGYITVESELGKGTTFYLYLSALPGLSLSRSTAAIAARNGHGRILVMDDEELICRLLDQMLKQLGYEVECSKECSSWASCFSRFWASIPVNPPPAPIVLMCE